MRQFAIDTSAVGKTIDQLIKQAARVRRVAELNAIFPGLEHALEDWVTMLDRQPFLIPKRLDKPYRNIGAQARDLFERYVNPDRHVETVDRELIGGLGEALSQRSSFLADIED